MTFTDYAAQKGILLLKDDISWLRSQILQIPKDQRKAILTRYVELWVKTRDNCQNPAKAQNEGRRASNTWLRGYINDTWCREMVQ